MRALIPSIALNATWESWPMAVVALLNTADGTVRVPCAPLPPEEAVRTLWASIGARVRPSAHNHLKIEVRDGAPVLSVWKGGAPPYFLSGAGITPRGVFVLEARTPRPATQAEIDSLIDRSDGRVWEERRAACQSPGFSALAGCFERRGLPFGRAQEIVLGLIDARGLYTNLAHILSDEADCGLSYTRVGGVYAIGPVVRSAAFRGAMANVYRKAISLGEALGEDAYPKAAFADALLHL